MLVGRHERFGHAAGERVTQRDAEPALPVGQARRTPKVDAEARWRGLCQLRIARRILCELRVGDCVTAGQRFGIIRFGSRTDLYLPPGVRPGVSIGQTAVGGETVMAVLEHAPDHG